MKWFSAINIGPTERWRSKQLLLQPPTSLWGYWHVQEKVMTYLTNKPTGWGYLLQ